MDSASESDGPGGREFPADLAWWRRDDRDTDRRQRWDHGAHPGGRAAVFPEGAAVIYRYDIGGSRMEKQPVIRMEDVRKTYQLGKIGGNTLQGQLQSWWALRKGKEDPNRKVWQKESGTKDFEALKGISCEIYQGERVGIIGRNGAGKSTMLKLLSRVTAPTKGKICIRGRISSMLEVGTGFHGELTGRENIYLNGAILGMGRCEVEEKMEDIIAFSECETFIDTPVKRYSSGMYVKLAFAVAAYLEADIFLMDEVLAVGDMMFQKKCLRKMKEISEDGQKTILYVSHNMQTIRELCGRSIVLDEGKILHDGDVDEGIRLYMQDILEVKKVYTFPETTGCRQATGNIQITRIETDHPVLGGKERFFVMRMFFQAGRRISGLHLRFTVHDAEDTVAGTGVSACFAAEAAEQTLEFTFDSGGLVEGAYAVDLAVVEPQGEKQLRHAYLERAVAFRIEKRERLYHGGWNARKWGNVKFPDLTVRNR